MGAIVMGGTREGLEASGQCWEPEELRQDM